MSNNANTQKLPFSPRVVTALVLFGLVAACHSPIRPSPNGTDLNLRTEPGPNWPDLTGTYTLTLSASTRCPLALPEAMRVRTYTATIFQVGGSLKVTLPSVFPPFGITTFGPDNRFSGAFGQHNDVILQFQFEEWFLEEPVTEFAAIGEITGTISPSGLSGVWDGYMRGLVIDEDGRSGRIAECTAPDHGVTLSR
jgi:hypothetical protein